MDPGAYPEPLLRTTFVNAPMVSGYTTSRLRVADFAFVGTATNFADNACHAIFENTSTGTLFYVQVNETTDDSPSGVRTQLIAPVVVIPGGRRTVDFYPNQAFIEFKCTSGQGYLRLQIASRLKWEEMAFDKLDTLYAQQLVNMGPLQ